jgi:hypothetical protein
MRAGISTCAPGGMLCSKCVNHSRGSQLEHRRAHASIGSGVVVVWIHPLPVYGAGWGTKFQSPIMTVCVFLPGGCTKCGARTSRKNTLASRGEHGTYAFTLLKRTQRGRRSAIYMVQKASYSDTSCAVAVLVTENVRTRHTRQRSSDGGTLPLHAAPVASRMSLTRGYFQGPVEQPHD